MKPSEELAHSLNHNLEKILKIKKDCTSIPVDLISEIFPDGSWYASIWNDITFTLPMSFSLIDSFIQMMSGQFPQYRMLYDNQFVWEDQKRAGRFITYVDDSTTIRFEVAFRSERNGSTCILNPIGKTTKEVIEYEVVCSEQAAEEFTIGEF